MLLSSSICVCVCVFVCVYLYRAVFINYRTILEGHTHLTAACIDALSNLNISTELEEEVSLYN